MPLPRFLWLMAVAASSCMAMSPDATAQDVAAEARAADRQRMYDEAQRDISIRVLDRIEATADSVHRELTALIEAHDQLKQRILGIQGNDEGKRLASLLGSIDSDELAHHIDRPEIISEDELAVNERNLTLIRKQLEAERAKVVPGYLPPEALPAEIDAIRAWVAASSSAIEARNNWFDMKLLAVPSTFDVESAPTFRVQWSEVKHQRAKELADARERAVQLAREEGAARAGAQAGDLERARIDQELQQAREEFETQREAKDAQHQAAMAELERKQAELLTKQQMAFEVQNAALSNELKLLQAQLNRDNADADAERARLAIEAEKVRLRQRVADPAVQGALAPFTTPGFYQPGQRLPDGKARPVSFSALQGAGMLGSDKDSMRRLVMFMISDKDAQRPRWAISTQSARWKPTDIAQIQEAQDLLLELGPTMVEMGLLSP